MRVLLIAANTETVNMPVLPLGMAAVAAATLKQGHDVLSLNLLGTDDIQASLEKAIQDIKPEAIGISVRNIDDQSMESPRFLLGAAKQLVDHCRQMCVAPVILGGAGYSIFPQSTLEYTGADFGLQGEGEEMFPLMLDFLNAGRNPASIPGVYIRGLERKNLPCFSSDLGGFSLPEPDGHLDFPDALEKKQMWLPYQTRRGCPMQCSYCSTPAIEGTTIRTHNARLIVENISRFADKGIQQFYFVDNIFNIPESYTEKLCDALIDADLQITWRCIIYPKKLSGNLAEKMAKAGCTDVSLGFESASAAVLGQLNKKYSPNDVRATSRMLNDCGIRQMGFLLLGGPGETRETVLKTLDFSDTLPLDSLKLTIGLRIYPDTPLAGAALDEGFITASDNLLIPRFYLRPELAEWLPGYIAKWVEDRPCAIF